MLLHEFCESHEHCISFHSGATVVVDATCSTHLTRVLLAAFLTQPYSVCSIFGGSGSSACFHTHAYRLARFMFSTNASVVGDSAAFFGAQAAAILTFILQICCLTLDIFVSPGV